jgi:hypothetical protein
MPIADFFLQILAEGTSGIQEERFSMPQDFGLSSATTSEDW